jgi:hypothetical protein
VPRWESKELLKHAEKKAEEIRKSNLPHVKDDFFIHIATEEDYALELAELLTIGLEQVRIDPDEKTYEILKWTKQHNTLVSNLDNKIEKLGIGINEQQQLRIEFIKKYIDGQNVLEKLHSEYPELYEVAKQLKNDRERFLAISSNIPIGTPPKMLHDSLNQFYEELSKQINGLEKHTIEIIVHEAISDWLLRCPLDFPKIRYNYA